MTISFWVSVRRNAHAAIVAVDVYAFNATLLLCFVIYIRVLQLVVVRSCTALAAGWCYAHGTYGEGHLNLSQGFVWVTLCNACSQGENY